GLFRMFQLGPPELRWVAGGMATNPAPVRGIGRIGVRRPEEPRRPVISCIGNGPSSTCLDRPRCAGLRSPYGERRLHGARLGESMRIVSTATVPTLLLALWASSSIATGLSGTVLVTGTLPKPKKLDVVIDQFACGTEKDAGDLVLSPRKELANAVV